jgi:hypothetical protein
VIDALVPLPPVIQLVSQVAEPSIVSMGHPIERTAESTSWWFASKRLAGFDLVRDARTGVAVLLSAPEGLVWNGAT